MRPTIEQRGQSGSRARFRALRHWRQGRIAL